MSKIKKFWWLGVSLLVVVLSGQRMVRRSLASDKLVHIVFCDVGQGDGILIYRGEVEVLIDSGPGSKIDRCLSEHMPIWDRKIEMIVMTHPDKDHIGGFEGVINKYEIGSVVWNGVAGKTQTFKSLMEVIERNKTRQIIAHLGEKLRVGSLEFDILWPSFEEGGSSSQTNERGIVSKFSFGKFDLLLTADVDSSIEDQLLSLGGLGQVEVLKVGHHGSKYSSEEQFLKVVMPALGIISVGEGNTYGHPTVEVLSRLSEVGVKVLRTDKEGDIEVVTNGETWWITE